MKAFLFIYYLALAIQSRLLCLKSYLINPHPPVNGHLREKTSLNSLLKLIIHLKSGILNYQEPEVKHICESNDYANYVITY